MQAANKPSNQSHFLGVRIALLVCLCLLQTACGDKLQKLDKLAPGDTIVAFGDSLTYGTGAAETESYPAVLAALIGRPVVRAGVPGETTAEGRERLPQVLAEHQPKLVLFCLGGNDMLRKLKESETIANQRAMLTLLRERHIAVVLIGVPRPALLSGMPEYYAQLAGEFKLPYEGKVMQDVLFKSDLKSDAAHPNAEGYRRIAAAIAGLLKRAGAI